MAEEIKNLKMDLDVANSILKRYELHKKLILLGARHYFGEMFKNGDVNTEECVGLSNIIQDLDSMVQHWKEIVAKAKENLSLMENAQ